ncbi:MAG: glycosyltransferase family 39 protein, partial [Lachnospiraceae bacterium]|nr:glycosyltransferase family 39 protein [Lachnospiraceae bacterium]
MEHKIKWDEIVGIVGMAVGAALLGVSVYLCFSSDIWYDELFTMGLADQSCGKLVSITAKDVHPPLYYLIVKFFLFVFGTRTGSMYSIVIAKLVSALPFFLCLLYALTKVRKHFGMLCAGIFSFLLFTMPQVADYMVEIRMYGYALFFILAAMLHAYELTHADKKKKWLDWTALTLYSLAACYTHYFACVAACMVYLYLLIGLCREHRMRQEGKIFFASGLLCSVAYAPWLVLAVTRQVGQVKENYWIPPLGWRSLGGCVKFLFQPFFSSQKLNAVLAVMLFMCYLVLLVGMVLRWKKQEKNDTAFFITGCVGVLLGIVFFGFLASFLIRPIFVYRYMLPALGVFWLAFSLLVSGLKEKKPLFILLFVLLVVVG